MTTTLETITNDSDSAKADHKTNRRVARIGAVAALLLSIGAATFSASPAGADLFNPRVKLQGTVSCWGYNGLLKTDYGKILWVYVTGSNGEKGWATRTGNMNSSKQKYSFQFNKIPASGKSITVTYESGCGTNTAHQKKFKKTFGLNRPKVGGSQTRNVCAGSLVRCF